MPSSGALPVRPAGRGSRGRRDADADGKEEETRGLRDPRLRQNSRRAALTLKGKIPARGREKGNHDRIAEKKIRKSGDGSNKRRLYSFHVLTIR